VPCRTGAFRERSSVLPGRPSRLGAAEYSPVTTTGARDVSLAAGTNKGNPGTRLAKPPEEEASAAPGALVPRSSTNRASGLRDLEDRADHAPPERALPRHSSAHRNGGIPMRRRKTSTRSRLLILAAAALILPFSLVAPAAFASDPSDTPILRPGAHFPTLDEEAEEELLAEDFAFISRRLAGDRPLTLEEAGAYRTAAVRQAQLLRKMGVVASGPTTFDGSWTNVGPSPIWEITRSTFSIADMNGRIGALAFNDAGEFVLGGAQGGIWIFDYGTGTWSPMTDNLGSLAIGALANAASDGGDDILYAGTGEGALSGDSYFGNGILKSMDGGHTWAHVSGDFFRSVSISRLVVDPTDANHLYAAVLRGRGGARRTSPPLHSKFGVWESKDGAATWTLVMETPPGTNGATDLEMDPQNPQILYTSIWGDLIYKSTDGGKKWAPIMNGLPTKYNAYNLTRWSIGLSHPVGDDAVLYVGTDVIDDHGDYQPSHLWRSDDQGGSWHTLPTTGFAGSDDNMEDYCGGQCFYDNVVEVDPSNTDIVYAGGQFNYDIGSGGIFRSDDGGQTWKNLGWEQHPDFHAFAFGADPNEVLSGSDGGIWWSGDRGGRLPGAGDEGDIESADWVPVNAYGLSIAQFTSIATNPTRPTRFWGGTQDNGTMRYVTGLADPVWADMYSGDGGQVLVDPTDWHYVYGTYYGISPYRATDGGGAFFTNESITNGINTNDRSDFYIPWVLNKDNPNQLFLGTYRLYRTDSAKAASASDVKWKAISPDLTSGCSGTAPNGARNCSISAIGIGGGTAVYTGSLDGVLYISTDGMTSTSPTWSRIDQVGVPKRPVTQIAVDRSNYRTAYVSYAGFAAGTPGRPGHVYKTTDAGKSWTDISGNLPDSPVNSIILDPSFPNTLYAGTDVGPFVTYDGGAHWSAMGSDFPIVAIWQLDLDPASRTMLAGTHGRGAFLLNDGVASAALVVSKVDAGVPVGPNSQLDYTITVRNIGNADATGITVTDPLPTNTSNVSVGDGGSFSGGKYTWSGISLAAGTSVDLHFSVSVAAALKRNVRAIVNDGIVVTSAEGPGATGSPTVSKISDPYKVSLAPASQVDGGNAGDTVTYPITISNLGYNADSYNLSSSGGSYAVSIFESDCSTPLASTGVVGAGATFDACIGVDIPGGAANDDTNVTTVTATSSGSASVSASGTITTIAVTVDTLLVDGDGNAPDVQSYYTAALTTAGQSYSVWDLNQDANLPLNYLLSFKTVVWYTGNAYPGPIAAYEDELAAFLDGGGRLFMSGQDILDQAAGTSSFVYDYLHIDWDGTETQNDISTAAVHDVSGTLTDGLGDVTLDHTVLGASYEDQITPVGPAVGIFTDDEAEWNALSYDGTYKVVFLAFPFEAYGSGTDQAALMTDVYTFFGP
jgi:uncharacterized repeat protein (TIGR01451 family)